MTAIEPNDSVIHRYFDERPIWDQYKVSIDSNGKIAILKNNVVIPNEEAPFRIRLLKPRSQGESMPHFGFYPFSSTYARLNFSDEYDYPPQEQTNEAYEEKKLEEKRQRAAVQTKRHKQKTHHIPAKKDVPSFLKNFVNKAK